MEKKPSLFKAILFALLYFIFYFIMSGVLGSVLNIIYIDGVPLSAYTTVYNIISSIVLFGLPPILYCKVKRISVTDTLRIRKLDNRNIVYSILVGLLLSPILSTLVGIFGYLFMGGNAQGAADEVMQSGFLLTFIGVAIVPSICEELTFRGLLVYKFRNLKPLQIAILTSVTFGFVHLNIVQGVYTIVMGFCFFYLVYYTGSLLAPIIAHFVVNGVNTIHLFISMKLAKPEELVEIVQTTSMLTEILYIIFAIVCSVVLYKLFGKIKATNIKETNADTIMYEN